MPKRGNASGLLDKMRARLSGGHFRMLNEKLYTCSGEDAFDYFKNDPKLFDVDVKNKMFILFYFRKKEKSKMAKSIDWPQLKPCLYKRR